MPPGAPEYSTKELTKDTLPDFETLFEKHPGPGAFGCWCLYHHRTRAAAGDTQLKSRAERAARNRTEKRQRVENGTSHGILVFLQGEPVGWCQYGLREELPRLDSYRSIRGVAPDGATEKSWRITCFVVDSKYRRRGVASAALKAALAAIRKKGGGLVEAYPIVRSGAAKNYLGTASMFEKEGFKIVAPFGTDNVVMRRTV